MESLKINETPVRTSRNFKINNIELNDEVFLGNFQKFSNVKIVNENSVVTDMPNMEKLTYGLGEAPEKNIFDNANNKLKIETTGKQENIQIIYEFDNDNLNLINYLNIIAKGKVNITIIYKSKTDKACFHNGVIALKAIENADITVSVINLLNNVSINLEAFENFLNENSKVKYTIIDLGGKTSIINYYSNIYGNNSKNDLKSIYLGTDNQIKDLNYIAELRGEKTEIDIDVQGALNGNAKKNFKGTIDFKRGCKKAKGNENEYCMLLSDTAKSLALPMLLCTEEDVEGNHSTASGKVGAKELFYIMSRGFSYEEAIQLIVKANFNKIIERIKDEEIRNIVVEEIEMRLDK